MKGNMRFDQLTIKAQEALQNAQEIAAEKNHGELKALHLLAALMEDDQCTRAARTALPRDTAPRGR